MKNIIIIGGGTGGCIVANLLAKKLDSDEAKITVISASEQHHYQPGWLYVPFAREDARSLTRPVRDLLKKQINLLIGKVKKLDDGNHQVILENGDTVSYDYLVIATGSIPCPEDIPGLSEGGNHFYTEKDSFELYQILQEFRGGKVVIGVGGLPYKCPVAPLEFTFLFEEFVNEKGIRDKTDITYTFPLNAVFNIPSVAEVAEPILQERNINIETFFNLEEVNADEKKALSLEGTELDYDLLIMIPPHRGAPFLQGHDIADAKGWVKTNKQSLRAGDSKNIWALGDTTDIPISKAGSTAHFEGPVIAKHIIADLRGEELGEDCVYEGHVMCFLETGYSKASIIDFDYSAPPVLKAPNALMHYQKMAFNKAYWYLIPTATI
ncbi:MAG: FAD/NAD(P)-binding oxidoreductase [Verrucomicrobiota bacterium]